MPYLFCLGTGATALPTPRTTSGLMGRMDRLSVGTTGAGGSVSRTTSRPARVLIMVVVRVRGKVRGSGRVMTCRHFDVLAHTTKDTHSTFVHFHGFDFDTTGYSRVAVGEGV